MHAPLLTCILFATVQIVAWHADAPSASWQVYERAGAAADTLPRPSVPSGAVSTNSDSDETDGYGARLAAAALAQTASPVVYDAAYVRIPYPMGDVPAGRGVCADVVVRAYRALGVDLQKRVHEDMDGAFSRYPEIWGLARPDSNIDHRRVPNLETFWSRHADRLPTSDDPADYQPGDIVTYRLSGGWLPHVAIVSSLVAPSGRPLIIHNIGAGVQLEDALFAWPMHRRYRWRPAGTDVPGTGANPQ